MRLFILSYIVLFFFTDFSYATGNLAVPTATLLVENGMVPEEPVILEEENSSYTGAAPLEFRFAANPSAQEGTLRYEWNFSEDAGFGQIFLTRFDEETTYTFNSTGIFYVRLIVTNLDDGQTYTSSTFAFQVSESELKVPNAFSPNGDGVHDVFKVQHKSLVRFNAYIFNRWGQEVYRWDLSNIDEGWDGTSHGKPVKEGVYFIMIEAEGADGRVFKQKSDINLLR